jgi:hypothetical protein
MMKKISIDHVTDLKNNMSLDDFTRYSYSDILDLTSINPDCEIELQKKEELDYITIKNFLMYPDDLKKFLVKFPCEDRMMSLEKMGITANVSKAPGFQQIFSAFYFRNISKFLHQTLEKNQLCHYEWCTNAWDFYTNCIHSGMKSYKQNYSPHLDEFNYAANIFLTDVENTGTSFFKFKGLHKEYYDFKSFSKLPEERENYKQYVTRHIPENEYVTEWPMFEGDQYFSKYHTIPGEYNSVSMYKGRYWHSIYFDATIPDRIRYSLVGVLKK